MLKSSLPFTFEWQAARHVFVHHFNGDAFGPTYLFDPLFSVAVKLFSYLHNDIFEAHIGKAGGVLLSVTCDGILGFICGVIMCGILLITREASAWIVNLLRLTPSVGGSVRHEKTL